MPERKSGRRAAWGAEASLQPLSAIIGLMKRGATNTLQPSRVWRALGSGLSALLLSLPLFFPLLDAGCAAVPRADWQRAEECLAQIREGRQEKVIGEAKGLLRSDRGNADAQACLAMAYYRGGNAGLALKRLRDVEDALPAERVQMIHDHIWNSMPELLAEKEYRDSSTLSGGDCMLRNVTALGGNGFLLIGEFYHPGKKSTIRHLRGYRCAEGREKCTMVDRVCPECIETEAEARIEITDTRIVHIVRPKENIPLSRNVAYIEKILELERGNVR